MNKKFLIVVFIVFTSSIDAQEDTLKNDVFGVFFHMPIELSIIDNQQLNNRLVALGYPKCEYPVVNFGFGFQLYQNRWILNFSFNRTTRKKEREEYLNEVLYNSVSINLGYDLTKQHRYSIYPYVGIKGFHLNYFYREKLLKETSFDDYFSTTLVYKEFSYSNSNLDLGIAFSYQWFFLVNFRAGYLVPLRDSKWTVSGPPEIMTNSPTLNYNYYFNLTIGMGTIYSNDEIRRHFNREDIYIQNDFDSSY